MILILTQCFPSRIGGVENLISNLALSLSNSKKIIVFASGSGSNFVSIFLRSGSFSHIHPLKSLVMLRSHHKLQSNMSQWYQSSEKKLVELSGGASHDAREEHGPRSRNSTTVFSRAQGTISRFLVSKCIMGDQY